MTFDLRLRFLRTSLVSSRPLASSKSASHSTRNRRTRRSLAVATLQHGQERAEGVDESVDFGIQGGDKALQGLKVEGILEHHVKDLVQGLQGILVGSLSNVKHDENEREAHLEFIDELANLIQDVVIFEGFLSVS